MARAYPGAPANLFEEAIATIRRSRRRLRERRCRLSSRPRTVDNERSIVTALQDFDLFVDRADVGLSRCLMSDGYWEMWLTEAIEAALRPGMVAIDIGANLGYFSLLMARCVGPTGRVHAFEPNPAIAALLAQSVEHNGLGPRVTLHGDPLWDEDGIASVLKIPEGEPKNAHLTADIGDHDEAVVLRTRRLDSFPDLLDVDLIKIDVEGAEERIWRGMGGLLARNRSLTIFLEFSPIRYEAPMDFLRQMLARGFTLGELSVSYGVRRVSPEQVLVGDPREDRMLALVRGSRT